MAITTADRDLLITTLLDAFGTNTQDWGKVLAKLEARFPAITWRARMSAISATYAFTDTGMDRAWWANEVGRQADLNA